MNLSFCFPAARYLSARQSRGSRAASPYHILITPLLTSTIQKKSSSINVSQTLFHNAWGKKLDKNKYRFIGIIHLFRNSSASFCLYRESLFTSYSLQFHLDLESMKSLSVLVMWLLFWHLNRFFVLKQSYGIDVVKHDWYGQSFNGYSKTSFCFVSGYRIQFDICCVLQPYKLVKHSKKICFYF